MNQTIRIYLNISEKRHNKILIIVKQLASVMKKVLILKKEISPFILYMKYQIKNSDNDNEITIVYKTSEHPSTIYLFLNGKAIMDLKGIPLAADFPLIALDYIHRATRAEYYRLGNIYNKRSSIMFVSNKSPFNRYKKNEKTKK